MRSFNVLSGGCTWVDSCAGHVQEAAIHVESVAIPLERSASSLQGLAYLLTFIFGANAVGLTALAVQLAFYPDSVSRVPVRHPPPPSFLISLLQAQVKTYVPDTGMA